MKAIDLLLLCLGIGLSLLNAAVLASDYPRDFLRPETPDPLAPQTPKNIGYKAVIVHDLDRSHPGRAFPFHFVIGDGGAFGDGDILPTPRWRKQEGTVVEIALSPRRTARQEASLRKLLERLRREYAIAPDRIGTHRELEPGVDCPVGIDPAALRR